MVFSSVVRSCSDQLLVVGAGSCPKSAELRSLDPGSCVCSLLVGIPVHTEYRISLPFRRFSRRPEVRVHVLPHNISFGRHLKKAPEYPFVYQSVAIRQALSVRDVWAIEVPRNWFLIFTYNFICRGVHLDHT